MNNNSALEKFQVCFKNPDFSPQADGGFNWTVRSMSWSLPGGADTAVLQLDDDVDSEGMGNMPLTALVGCPLNILSAQGRVVWHGWVETAARTRGGVRSSCSTHGMANCVIARLPNMSDAAEPRFDRWKSSDWMEDAASIARFGRKEHLVALPYMNAQAVNEYLTAALSGGNAWPAMRIDPADKDQPDGLKITARGWWQRLDWVLDGQHNSGREMHLEGGKTHLEIGSSLSQSKLAQSWKTNEIGFNIGQVWLRAAIVGEPLDDLLVSLYADDNGIPGELLAQCNGETISIHGGWQWLCWTFDAPVAVTPGTLIWLVLYRSGSNDENNYFAVQSDDGHGYNNGSLKRWNGSAWIGINHDLRFCCLSVSQSSDLISEMLQRAAVAPFLQGVQVWQDCAVQTVRWREIGKTCRETVQDLLAASAADSNFYSLLINTKRYAEVLKLPQNHLTSLTISSDGELCEANGEPIGWDIVLLGREVLVGLPSGQYTLLVKCLRWTPATGLRIVNVGSYR